MWVVLILGPIGLNFAGVAWAGMEHALHVAATLAVLCGIQTYLQTGQLTWLLLSGVLFGPLLRFEGLAVSLAVALVIVLTSSGKGKRGMSRVAGIICLGIIPVSLFCVFLMQLGLSALPNSVQAKLANASSHDALTTSNLVEVISSKFDRFPAVVLFSVLLVAMMIFLWNFRSMPPKFRAILGAMVFAGAGHLALGQFGWLNRYEIYIMTFVVGLFILFVTEKYAARPAIAFFLIVSPLLASGYYYSLTNQLLAFSSRVVAMQQKQMARFVDEFYQNPVAVNDLGYVSWQNPHYVLDLWGLASAQALSIRQSNPAAGWAVPLLADNSVELAMLYKDWLHNAVGPDWVELGDLVIDGPLGVVGNANVTFYATTEEAAVRLHVMLSDYARTLPDGVEFRFSQQSEQP
ncbi:hypothetical protein [Halocynthiibacter styelae]|uniref:Uncharacterized protein n=1 Tax=Halocynthiibacter styelae TaxID=2761955 RepID=A0A8J7LRA2_9RHOB|nr:hypothetical protein [Paenihalocynthiibacter styelae]MBI1495347.1 hypothetical protein [Paenihalocynthiibacter styelae]